MVRNLKKIFLVALLCGVNVFANAKADGNPVASKQAQSIISEKEAFEKFLNKISAKGEQKQKIETSVKELTNLFDAILTGLSQGGERLSKIATAFYDLCKLLNDTTNPKPHDVRLIEAKIEEIYVLISNDTNVSPTEKTVIDNISHFVDLFDSLLEEVSINVGGLGVQIMDYLYYRPLEFLDQFKYGKEIAAGFAAVVTVGLGALIGIRYLKKDTSSADSTTTPVVVTASAGTASATGSSSTASSTTSVSDTVSAPSTTSTTPATASTSVPATTLVTSSDSVPATTVSPAVTASSSSSSSDSSASVASSSSTVESTPVATTSCAGDTVSAPSTTSTTPATASTSAPATTLVTSSDSVPATTVSPAVTASSSSSSSDSSASSVASSSSTVVSTPSATTPGTESKSFSDAQKETPLTVTQEVAKPVETKKHDETTPALVRQDAVGNLLPSIIAQSTPVVTTNTPDTKASQPRKYPTRTRKQPKRFVANF